MTLTNFASAVVPCVEQLGRPLRAGVQLVPLDEDAQPLGVVPQHVAHAEVVDVLRALLRPSGAVFLVGLGRERQHVDHRRVAQLGERAVGIVDVGDCRPTCRPRSCARSRPSTTTTPPVMYSQPWSPVPSTTAIAPELRTAKRSPATPLK
jgi:hypothetical protein